MLQMANSNIHIDREIAPTDDAPKKAGNKRRLVQSYETESTPFVLPKGSVDIEIEPYLANAWEDIAACADTDY